MSIKQPIYHEFDLNATSGSSRVISLTHTDDAHVDTIELCVKQNGSTVDLTGSTVIARMVLHSTTDILLDDSVPCTINDAGNILIPFDNAAVQTRKGIVKIEVNITRDPDILTLQLPLWVKINGSILDSATVDPHSEGTIPELLEEVKEELERVKDFATAEDVFEILDSALEGNPSVAPTLLIDNTVDQQFNPDGHWILYYIDSDDLRHNIFDFANLPSGASDYTGLENKPQINNVTLSGNQSSDDLGLQKKLAAGTNITIGNDGTISASGGVTDYLQLNNKPVIHGGIDLDSWITTPIQGTILLNNEDFKVRSSRNPSNPSRDEFGINLSSSVPINYMQTNNSWGKYDFNSLKGIFINSGTFRIPVTDLINKPSIFESFIGDIFITHYFQECSDLEGTKLIRFAVGTNADHKNLCFWQIVSMTNEVNEYVVELYNNNWQELAGGSQIVSGVVNQNGTITFTDSDGNSFTTTGSKLVTSGSEQISMGYDSGGFYFLFDDGQEVS